MILLLAAADYIQKTTLYESLKLIKKVLKSISQYYHINVCQRFGNTIIYQVFPELVENEIQRK